MPILLYGIVALAYAVLALHFWRTRWNTATAHEAALWERIAILAPLLVHSWLLYQDLFATAEFRFGFVADGKKSTPACSASVASCSIAAGRYTSQETSRGFFR